MQIDKNFHSKRNCVRLIQDNEHIYVEKKFFNLMDYRTECEWYMMLRKRGFYIPKLLNSNTDTLTLQMEYIQGITLLEHLEILEAMNDQEGAILWMSRLFENFKRLNQQVGCYYSDVNLRNFLVLGDRLYLLDFEAIRSGKELPIAKTLAFYLLYRPMKTSFKQEVVKMCLCNNMQGHIEPKVWEWVEHIEQRRL